MNEKTRQQVNSYIENMKWERINRAGVRQTMLGIVDQFTETDTLTPGQVNALRRTCLWTNYERPVRNTATWRSVGKSGPLRG